MSLWRVDSADDEALLKKSEAELTAAQAEWEENKKTLETKKSEYLQTAMAERESHIHQLTVSKANELNGIQARIREAEKKSISFGSSFQHLVSSNSVKKPV